MLMQFSEAGFTLTREDASDEPDAVVIGSIRRSRMPGCRAAWWIQRGKLFVATNPTRLPDGPADGARRLRPICAMLESHRSRPRHRPKPDPAMLGGILAPRPASRQIAMVGDRIYTDILMAHWPARSACSCYW